MKTTKYLSILILLLPIISFSQDTIIYYLNEDFEVTPRNWQSLKPDKTPDDVIKWTYQNGGNNGNPISAFHGSYNAYFYWNDFDSKVRDLISVPINLSPAVKPLLTFYHTQAQSGDGTDELMVLFRTSATAPWDTIATYSSAISSWTKRNFYIDAEGSQYLTGQFYLAFRGTANGGHGICIDSVKIVETSIITRYISSVTASDIVYPMVPSGVKALPVFRINMEVAGNNGTLILDSLKIKSTSPDNSVFESNGFQLFYTRDEIFKNKDKGVSTKLGSSVSISNGYIKFTGLNKSLKTGNHYLWLAVDVKPEDIHNKDIDFMVEANNIFVSGTAYPASGISSAGENTIEESIFYDNFDSDKGWSLDNDFERDIPKGKFVIKSSDPDFAYSGSNVLGTDLNDNGAYKLNIDSSSAYFATTPSMNMKYFDRIKLSMMKWIAFEQQDEASIDISTDGGSTWQKLWSSQVSGQLTENAWNNLYFYNEVNSLARRKTNVKFRFAMNFSDDNNAYAGWNIDNFAVTGEYLTNDVGISQIILPCSDCKNSGLDSIRVVVRNYAAVPTPVNLPLFFSLNGNQGPKIYDTLKTSITVDDSAIFTFKTPANFPAPGNYNFLIATDKSGDQDRSNDSLYAQLKIQDNITPPELVDFETGDGYWINDGVANTWICKVPDESIGQIPGSPKAWLLSPFGNYADDDSSFLISSCYNLAGSEQLVLELKYTNISQAGHDGANVQYTINDGNTWSVLQNNTFGYNWNWYTSLVSGLGQNGWSGNSGGWKTSRTLIPISLLTQPRVKFRVLWMSDSDPTEGSRGIGLDDFSIYPAPPDVGVLSVDLPETECLYTNPNHITLSVKNFGVNKVQANDTILIGYEFEGGGPVYKNLVLTSDFDPGDTIQYSFTESIDISEPGTYQVIAYSLFEDDPWFYGYNNDTVEKSFDVLPLPITGLWDTISSREPDTVVIHANYNAGYTYQWDKDGLVLSTADTLKVPSDGWFNLLITDVGGNGCSITDSIYVELLYFDAGINSLLSPVNSCELGDNEFIQVQVKNYGTDSIVVGSKIALWYELDENSPVNDTLTLASSLQPNQSIPFTFASNPVDLSNIDVYNLKLYSYFGGDTIRTNDTLNTNIEVYGYPTVNLGKDTTVKALNYNLNAGTGFSSYLWENGDTLQNHLISNTGYYHITVLDEHGCPDRDTIYVRLKIRDVMPNALLSPVSTCQMASPVYVQLQVKNNGTDTVPAGSKIYVKYKINSNPYRNDSIPLTTELIPGATRNHNFTTQENLTSYGDYRFTLYASTPEDLLIANDNQYDTVFNYAKPVVDFGLPDLYITEAVQTILNGGAGEYFNYLWQNNSTNQTYTATITGDYKVKVTDSRTGCYGKDSVFIQFVYKDVGITSVTLPSSICSGPQNNVPVKIKNLGNTTLSIGTIIQIVQSVNGVITGQENRTLTQVLAFGAELNHTLSTPVPIPRTIPFNVKVFTVMNQDRYASNDTFTKNYATVKLSPLVDFGDVNGILSTTFPHVLDAGAGQPSYLWNNGTTLQTLIAPSQGAYSVTVTASNGCQTFKSVTLTMYSGLKDNKSKALKVLVYPNPASEFFNLEIDATEQDDMVIEIYNSNGMLMHQAETEGRRIITEEFDVNEFDNGLYFIKIYNSKVNYTGKLIVQ